MNVLGKDIPELNLKAESQFIVMEYIPNNLHKYVESQRTPESKGLPLGLVWNFIKQIANGLLYLHSLTPSVSHRDLKPDNILVSMIHTK
jgi:serine/threonine protein kinase